MMTWRVARCGWRPSGRRPPMPQHGARGVDAAPRRRHPDQAEHRASFSCASGSSGTTRSNGASSTRVAVRHPQARLGRDPGRVLADDAVLSRPSGNSVARAAGRRSSGVEQVGAGPLQVRAAARRRPARTMSTDSLVHSTELSKLLLSTIRRAAVARSAVASTSTGTLPGPTPSGGGARAVGGAHHRPAPGRDDDAGAARRSSARRSAAPTARRPPG